MIDYLTYYYDKRAPLFRSLSALSSCEAIRLMEDLYARFEGSVLFERFSDPVGYLELRRQTEQWVREQFIRKGGAPQEAYPIAMVLGASRWIERHAPGPAETQGEMRIPLAIFAEGDVSFTYPDSMISFVFDRDRPAEFYQPEYHGQVFTRSEILGIIAQRGLPEDGWGANLPDDLAPYIEAQVWNHSTLAQISQGKRDWLS